MLKNRSIAGLIIVLSFFALGICQRAAAKKGGKIEIKIGSYITPNSAWGKAVNRTVAVVKKETDGNVVIKHLHSGMLGSNQSMIEQVLHGGIQGAGVDTSALATIVPEINVLELPFLFEDRDEAYYLIDKVINPYLQEKMEAKGLVTSAVMEIGFMDFVMSGPVHKPADLKKMKIGSWESPVHIAFWKSLGANPIPIPATEVFSAYSRGMVDSGANSPSALIAWDKLFGNALKRDKIFITRIGFTYHAGIMVIDKKFYRKGLSPEQREILEKALWRMTLQLRKDIREDEPRALSQLKAAGYNMVEMTPAERAVFVKDSEKIYGDFKDEIGAGFLKKVLDARAKYRAAKKKAS